LGLKGPDLLASRSGFAAIRRGRQDGNGLPFHRNLYAPMHHRRGVKFFPLLIRCCYNAGQNFDAPVPDSPDQVLCSFPLVRQ
jgi:uncharacterized NAD(P)/FAD-binding protein YdhS